jgi:hypothetical protein
MSSEVLSLELCKPVADRFAKTKASELKRNRKVFVVGKSLADRFCHGQKSEGGVVCCMRACSLVKGSVMESSRGTGSSAGRRLEPCGRMNE